jgi:ABC-type oligopeptide transport system ATPase subunit
MTSVLLDVADLSKQFAITRGLLINRTIGQIKAVDNISFSVARGETLGLVGESGSGKSTTARLVMRLLEPSSGCIRFDGTDILGLSSTAMRRFRQRIQIVFQDPFSSLNPRQTVAMIVAEPLMLHHSLGPTGRRDRVIELLSQVGLSRAQAELYPHEFSGGQRQRIGIARALAAEPDLIVCDEPVSALDVSIQAQVLNLLRDLQDRLGLAYLFITHDLAVVRYMAHRVAVMQHGRIIETATTDALFRNPSQAYTQSLLAAVPSMPVSPAASKRLQLISALAGSNRFV